ncbi:tryptophan synthase subunit alpha [Woodsholea maritima]|uniref:tryptophan synthase subunit alpha n=1 Tax=Woodsholea maritima TaxID=240237 RepID=UPI000361A3EB|nr:tryptophan synthase subunit alpha [Woodsholea maritima]
MNRLDQTFSALKAQNKAAFIAYVMAGDPDAGTTLAMMKGLADKGADVIELGLPFTDPMADGPTIQGAALRALASGMSVKGVLKLVEDFRQTHPDTPVVAMGYANPIFIYGFDAFAKDAARVGIDGLICVDIPPEEDEDLRTALESTGLSLIRLATPTTDEARLPRVVANTSGFVYYVSTTGVTGAKTGESQAVNEAVARVKAACDLPVAVGFGVKTSERARDIAQSADAVVVGSAIVEALHTGGVDQALHLAADLAQAAHSARG